MVITRPGRGFCFQEEGGVPGSRETRFLMDPLPCKVTKAGCLWTMPRVTNVENGRMCCVKLSTCLI